MGLHLGISFTPLTNLFGFMPVACCFLFYSFSIIYITYFSIFYIIYLLFLFSVLFILSYRVGKSKVVELGIREGDGSFQQRFLLFRIVSAILCLSCFHINFELFFNF